MVSDDALYYHDNTFYIGAFDEDMEDYLIIPFQRCIRQQADEEEGLIDMYINSYGGWTHLAFHLVEMMELAKSYGITVRTIVTNSAMSSGSIVSVAGTPGQRFVSKNAIYLIHYGYIYPAVHSTPLQVDRERIYQKNHFKHILNHYKKYCDIPDLEERMKDDDWYLTAAQAKRWGVADHYLDRLDPF